MKNTFGNKSLLVEVPLQGTDSIDTGPRAMPGATMDMPFQGAHAMTQTKRAMPAALSRSQSPPIGAVVRGLTLRTTMVDDLMEHSLAYHRSTATRTVVAGTTETTPK
jgi:hypothetical protein